MPIFDFTPSASGVGSSSDTQILFNDDGSVAGFGSYDGSLVTLSRLALTNPTTTQSFALTQVIPNAASGVGLSGFLFYLATESGNANNQGTLRGADFVVEHDGSGTITDLFGLDGDAELFGSGAATTMVGVRGIAHAELTATATHMAAFKGVFGGSATITNAYGVLLEEDGTAGTVTNKYGFLSPDFTAGTNIYGFYTAQSSGATKWAFYGAGTAKSQFGGAVNVDGAFTLSGTKTLSLAANFTTSGANPLTLTTTGSTNVTLPTAGTLVTLAGSESITNKKLGSLTSNGFVKTSGGDGTLSVASIVETFGTTIGDGSTVLTTGLRGAIQIPYAHTITAVRVLADVSGSAVFDIGKHTYSSYDGTLGTSIVASAKPTLSTAIKAEDTTLTGWTTSGAADAIYVWNVDSASTVKRVTVQLIVTRT